jgi:hypothetical protein
MNKDQLLQLASSLADGEVVAFGGWWGRGDVEAWSDEALTDDQWARFVHWYQKYQDSSADYDEALAYAKGKN